MFTGSSYDKTVPSGGHLLRPQVCTLSHALARGAEKEDDLSHDTEQGLSNTVLIA